MNKNFYDIFTFENLYKAHLKSRLSKRYKKEVIEFELSLGSNITKLLYEILNHKYRINGYNTFYIYEPKKRKVDALHYRDRIVQHCICDNYLTPLLDKRLIYDNSATRIGKGTSFARKRLKHFYLDYFNKNKTNDGYVLKCDIHHFFESIDHDKLKELLKKDISDRDILEFLFIVIDSYQFEKEKGLPIGNQTSQVFAIRYLDEMDRLIKEKYKIKYYVRYMDDFLLIHKSKDYLKEVLNGIEKVLKDYKLELNSKTRIYNINEFVEFLGFSYRLMPNQKIIMKLNGKRRQRFKKKMNIKIQEYKKEVIKIDSLKQTIKSYYGHIKNGNYCYIKEFTSFVNDKLSNEKQ